MSLPYTFVGGERMDASLWLRQFPDTLVTPMNFLLWKNGTIVPTTIDQHDVQRTQLAKLFTEMLNFDRPVPDSKCDIWTESFQWSNIKAQSVPLFHPVLDTVRVATASKCSAQLEIREHNKLSFEFRVEGDFNLQMDEEARNYIIKAMKLVSHVLDTGNGKIAIETKVVKGTHFGITTESVYISVSAHYYGVEFTDYNWTYMTPYKNAPPQKEIEEDTWVTV